MWKERITVKVRQSKILKNIRERRLSACVIVNTRSSRVVELSNGDILTVYYAKIFGQKQTSILWTRWSIPK